MFENCQRTVQCQSSCQQTVPDGWGIDGKTVCCPYSELVALSRIVDFIDRNEKASRETNKNTLLSNCKNTANTYKRTAFQQSMTVVDDDSETVGHLITCNITSPMSTPRACHLKMKGNRKIDRLTQGRQSMVIDYYWTVSNVNCKPTTPSITPH